MEKMLSGQDQLLLVYGQKEARTFTLQGTESSPSLVPQLYRNLFSSLEGRLQPIASHKPSGLHHTVPQDPYQATATRKEVLMNLAGEPWIPPAWPESGHAAGVPGPRSGCPPRASRNLSPALATRARSWG